MKSEFDELLKQRFEHGTLEEHSPQWSLMASKLEGKGGRKKFWLLFSASAMAASIAFAMVVLYPVHPPANNDLPTAVSSADKELINGQNNVQPAQKETTRSHSPLQRSFVISPGKKDVAENAPVVVDKVEPSVVQSAAPANEKKKPLAPKINFQTNNDPAPETNDDRDYAYEDQSEKRKHHTSISFAGGLNYGSLNAGYSLGINARTKLSRKIFIEGDLAYLNSNAVNASAEKLTGSPVIGTSNVFNIVPTDEGGRQRTVTSINTLPYLQFNPAFGYEITRRISLSAGADIQRLLLQDNIGELVYEDGDDRLIPYMDYGLSGKAEVTVTKRLKTGLQYRFGLNNLVRGSSEYFERRYLQVQLKFRFVGR